MTGGRVDNGGKIGMESWFTAADSNLPAAPGLHLVEQVDDIGQRKVPAFFRRQTG